jgi:molybdopterin synthase sulfur carrier subunit
VAKISFTERLRAVGPTQACIYAGSTLAEVLDRVAADYPKLKPYVLDEHGRLRKHVAVFIDGELKRGQDALTFTLAPASEVYVMQALSGG